MVRSPKSISGTVGATLGNAPYSDSDRTKFCLKGIGEWEVGLSGGGIFTSVDDMAFARSFSTQAFILALLTAILILK